MIEIEFIKDYKTCWRKGQRRKMQAHFAKVMIDHGYAKAISKPPMHKMIEKPEKEKLQSL